MSNLGHSEHIGLSEFATRLANQDVDQSVISNTLTQLRQDLVSSHAQKDLDELYTAVAACRFCDNVSSTPFLSPWKQYNPDVLIVGLRPFRKTQADYKLIECLKEAGLRSSNTGYTSLIRCIAEDEKDQQQLQTIISNCTQRFLFAEIERLNPTVICPMGNHAISVLLGEPSTAHSKHIGMVHYVGSYTVYPLSAAILFSESTQQQKDQFIDMAKKVGEIAGI